jgi:hypothetical protein
MYDLIHKKKEREKKKRKKTTHANEQTHDIDYLYLTPGVDNYISGKLRIKIVNSVIITSRLLTSIGHSHSTNHNVTILPSIQNRSMNAP